MKIAFTILLAIHGLSHLIGVAKAYNLAEIEALKQPIGKTGGLFWLLAAALFVMAIVLLWSNSRWWWLVALAGVVVSQVLIFTVWSDARFGTIANIIILVAVAIGYGQFDFNKMVAREVAKIQSTQPQPQPEVVSEERVALLPAPVQKWMNASGMIGRQQIRHVQLKQNFNLKLQPDQEEWYLGKARQEVWTQEPAFVWTLDLKMMSVLQIAGRDRFADGKGAMLIKMLSLVPMVNEQDNPRIDQGALQRYLAEMLWYPSLALSEFVSWKPVNENSAIATMDYRGTSGECTFFFNSEGMPDRVSAMRYRGGDEDAVLTEWVVEVQELRTMDGLQIPAKCAVTWKLDSGDWTWAELEVTEYRHK